MITPSNVNFCHLVMVSLYSMGHLVVYEEVGQLGLQDSGLGKGFVWSIGRAWVGISQVRLSNVCLCGLHSIEINFLVSGVSVQEYQGPWGPCKGVTSKLSPSGMDSAVPGWVGGISPYCKLLGWLRWRGCCWI